MVLQNYPGIYFGCHYTAFLHPTAVVSLAACYSFLL